MFAKSYFAGPYFAPVYFPPAEDALEAVVPKKSGGRLLRPAPESFVYLRGRAEGRSKALAGFGVRLYQEPVREVELPEAAPEIAPAPVLYASFAGMALGQSAARGKAQMLMPFDGHASSASAARAKLDMPWGPVTDDEIALLMAAVLSRR